MFERFDATARKIMGLARQEAQRLKSEFIDTEHILLGILLEGGGEGARILKELNIDSKVARQQVDSLLGQSKGGTLSLGQIPFSPGAKRAIELGAEQADDLDHDIMGSGHLLLGLLLEDRGIAARVLKGLGLDADMIRLRVSEIRVAGRITPPAYSPRAHKAMIRAIGVATEMGSTLIDPEHLLLGLLQEKEGKVAEMLAAHGVNYDEARVQLFKQ